MNQLEKEVARLAASAEIAEPNTEFLTRIVQIRFNAWHYVEGNLWASLVEHIFRNLRLSRDEAEDVTEDRRRYFLMQLDDAVAKRAEAETTIQKAEAERDTLTKRIADENQAAQAATAHLVETAKLAARDLLQFSDDERKLVSAAAKDLDTEIDHLHAFATGGRQFLRWLFHGPGAMTRLLVFFAVLVGAALAAFFLVDQRATKFLASVATFAATLASGMAALRVRSEPILKRIDKARDTVDKAYREAETRKQQLIAVLEDDKKNATDALKAARGQLSASERAADEARKALEHLSDDRKLVRFIDQRIASDDYRKFLGVLAVVRSDFERLSHLMNDAAIVEAAGKNRIDRIVLYIDDLDRCPARYVRDVLQAVHLLLAFKLFVVVVGVDTRWVTRSLEHEYRDEMTSAHDYLEKIFQIHFWIESLTVQATRKLLSGLIDVRTDAIEESGAEVTSQPMVEIENAPPPDDGAGPPAAGPAQVPPPRPPKPGDDPLNPAPLMLEPAELKWMHELAPLIGRSPRSVKRFANIYRIMRAARTSAELEQFVGSEYEYVLILLGIVTGVPSVSMEMFGMLAMANSDEKVTTFFERIRSTPPAGAEPDIVVEWNRACNVLIALDKGSQVTVGLLRPCLHEVARYSFREPFV